MSSAGHILDMITRLRNNEIYRKMIKSRYQDMKEQYFKHSSRYREFIDRPELSEGELNEIK